jgi:long-chain acyl-CoA synthetase
MERIWLKQYPPGVPADIDTSQYGSLVELLEESFAKLADRKAFICMDKSISYRDLRPRSCRPGCRCWPAGSTRRLPWKTRAPAWL